MNVADYYPYLVPRLRTAGAIPRLSCAFMVFTETSLRRDLRGFGKLDSTCEVKDARVFRLHVTFDDTCEPL